DHDSVVRRLPYAMQIAGATYPSFAAKIAGRAGGTGETFPLDYAIRIGSMPVVSAIDILEDKDAPGRLAGRDVVIGATSAQLDNVYFAPTVGLISGVFLHALGAETLLTGKPHTLSWIVPFLAVWLSIVALMVPRSRVMAITGYALMSVAVLLVPLMLDAHQILVDIVPTMLLLILIGGWTSWSGLRLAYRQRAIVNVVSGLPNLNALRAVAHVADVVLIAARVRNFPEITASLPADHERALVEQIARRLALGSGGATIYQGDEGIFAWLAPTQSVAQTADYFDAMQALFRNALTVGERRVDVAITFGLAADVGQSPFNRLGGALMAADAAAEAGLHWTLHEPVEASDSSWKLGLLTHLDAAIDGGEIWVAYQPKIDLRSDRIVGCEALVRWTHPEKGPISPADFIPVAEQQNRIDKLTYHVLDTAIHTAATINGHGMPFSVAVNLSVRVLEDPELLDRIAGLLARYALAPNLLTLEITETAALSGSRRSIEVLEALRATGVGLSIDDYGTGFSNLENLRTIPASEIKIDRSFVDAIEHSRADAVMVRSTIHMAHSLGQAVVAEGVERAETLAMLRQMGCDQVQGYLTGRPMKFAALSRCLILDRRKAAA
ncbi:MAG TPA: EAL domain-containing protein, partial [Sphingomonas sp.]|uniref:EAL domain-containing protein n=1 Tax=Sphingomonas sp. TaxID=28214 RepID=UPI002EDB0C02